MSPTLSSHCDFELTAFSRGHPAFYFAESLIHRASGCDVYRIDTEKFNAVNKDPAMGPPKLIFGYYRYDIDNVRRKRHIEPRAPRGMNNEAVQRLYDRRLAHRPLYGVSASLFQ